ncbi:MAG: PilZ domain-containing protein [Terriglobales bacterium]
MNKPESSAAGTDWTKLLKDPEIASHLGELLKAYREAPAEKRDQALLAAMSKIKSGSAKTVATGTPDAAPIEVPCPVATEPESTPPFEPDIFTPNWGQDRRRYPRMKCFVAVELRMDGSTSPVWGNLSNTSMGGCLVETASLLHAGVKLEIGLWVANGKIWVKGLIIDGVIVESSPSFSVRIKFSEMALPERESLRQFLRFVENTTKGYHYQHGYLAQLKR